MIMFRDDDNGGRRKCFSSPRGPERSWGERRKDEVIIMFRNQFSNSVLIPFPVCFHILYFPPLLFGVAVATVAGFSPNQETEK